jgi:hypothetical protein
MTSFVEELMDEMKGLSNSSRQMVTDFCEVLCKQNRSAKRGDILEVLSVFNLLKFRGTRALKTFVQRERFRRATEELLKRKVNEHAVRVTSAQRKRARSMSRFDDESAAGPPPNAGAPPSTAAAAADDDDDEQERSMSSKPYKMARMFQFRSTSRAKAGGPHLPDQYGVTVAKLWNTNLMDGPFNTSTKNKKKIKSRTSRKKRAEFAEYRKQRTLSRITGEGQLGKRPRSIIDTPSYNPTKRYRKSSRSSKH